MSFGFKKVKRANIRRKMDSDDEGEGKASMDNEPTFIASASKENGGTKSGNSERKPLSLATVSFGGDDEEDGETSFRLKKSSDSERYAKKLKKKMKQEELLKFTEVSVKREQKEVKREKKSVAKDTVVVLTGDDLTECVDDMHPPNHEFRSLTDILASGEVPDARLIHMARKQREKARELGGTVNTYAEKVDKVEATNSRLVREDDDDKDSDDECSKLLMSVKQKEEDERQRRADDVIVAEDEEDLHWEHQQIRKGMGLLASAREEPAPETLSHTNGSTQPYYAGIEKITSAKRNQEAVSVSQLCSQLQDLLDEMKHSKRCNELERQGLVPDEENVEELRAGISVKETTYKLYQHIRNFVEDFIDCYSTKMPSLGAAEDRMLSSLQRRRDAGLSRRRQDVVDQMQECQHFNTAAAPPLVMTEVHQRRVTEREGRRMRRRQKRCKEGVTDNFEGMSSDDEDVAREVTGEVARVKSEAELIMSDVSEDFLDVADTLSVMTEWRCEERASYSEAYISTCLAKLLVPLLRFHLFNWNPVEDQYCSLADHQWLQALVIYSDMELDLKLVPLVVEKVILGKLNAFVEKVWDPLSEQQTRKLSASIDEAVNEFVVALDKSKMLDQLLTNITLRMRESLDNDIYTPLYPQTVLMERGNAASKFYYRQVWRCVKLFKCLHYFENILSHKVLQDLMLNGLLNKYVMLSLTNMAVSNEVVAMCYQIQTSVPRSWFRKDGPTPLPQLVGFAKYLYTVVAAVSRGHQEQLETYHEFFLAIGASVEANRCISELGMRTAFELGRGL